MQDDVTEAVVLLPCPFCGASGRSLRVVADGGYWVTCDTCDVEGPAYIRSDFAIAAWNTRAAMPSRDAIEREAEARVAKWLELTEFGDDDLDYASLVFAERIEARKHLTEQGEG